jgi:NAD(P)-dependent dehydrogenase (short-subunit alcohol dehydrogenase family)
MSKPVVAISGVSRGIGAGVAEAFLNADWRVLGFGRSRPAWVAGTDAEFFECDMADPAGVKAACGRVSGSIDVLICNAATFGSRAFHLHDFDPAAFGEAFSTNVVSPVVMAQSLYPYLDQGGRRLIVMMSTGNASLSGNTEGSMLAYRCSKSALNQAVRNLAAEWGLRGFTTVALNPGWVRTEMGGPNAPLAVEEAARKIYHFVSELASPSLNGKFVNTDGSDLPW